MVFCFFFQAEDGIRVLTVTGVQTCALPISPEAGSTRRARREHSAGPPPDRGLAGAGSGYFRRASRCRNRPGVSPPSRTVLRLLVVGGPQEAFDFRLSGPPSAAGSHRRGGLVVHQACPLAPLARLCDCL